MEIVSALKVTNKVVKYGKMVMPLIKSQACKQCGSLMSITVINGNIRITKCRNH